MQAMTVTVETLKQKYIVFSVQIIQFITGQDIRAFNPEENYRLYQG